MVRFVLSSDKATLADGIYTYNLDTRLGDASSFALKKCSFQLTTDGTAPLAVFLRSGAIHRLSSHKHTLELKDDNHQSASNILAVLEESHTTGRYRLRGFPRPVGLGYSHLRALDFYFTDPSGTNVLLGGGGGGGSSNIPTAATVGARSDLWMFLDFSNTDKLTLNAGALGLSNIESVNNADLTFATTNGTEVDYSAFGDGKCADFTADWIRLTDSSNSGESEPENATFMMLFESQASQDDYGVFDFGRFKAYSEDGTVSFDPSNANPTATTMKLKSDTAYLLTIQRDSTKGATDMDGFIWRLEDLSNNYVQTHNGEHYGQATGGQYDYGGVASASAAGTKVSNAVVCSNLGAADQRLMEWYLRDYHTAQSGTRTVWKYEAMEDNMQTPSGQTKKFHICRCYDDGGSSSQYANNQNFNRHYVSLGGGNLSIKFTSFGSEASYDKLTITEVNADESDGAVLLNQHCPTAGTTSRARPPRSDSTG